MESTKTISPLWLRLGFLAPLLAMGPGPTHAQSAGWPQTAWASADRESEPSGAGRLLGLRLPFSGFGTSIDSTGRRYSLAIRPAVHGRLTTAIEYRLSPRGPIGSLGLQTTRDGPDIEPYEFNNAAVGLGSRGPEARVGARIAYRF